MIDRKKIGFLIGLGLAITISHNNCASPKNVEEGKSQSSSSEPFGDDSIVVPTQLKNLSSVSPDAAIGECSINMIDHLTSFSLNAVPDRECAEACAANSSRFPLHRVTCSFGGNTIFNRGTSRIGDLCRIKSGESNKFESKMNQVSCVKSCAAYAKSMDTQAPLDCRHNATLLYQRGAAEEAAPLGTCQMTVLDPAYQSSATLSQTTNARCQAFCNLVGLNTGVVPECVFTELDPQPVTF